MPSPTNAGRRFPAEALTPDEVRALLAACGRRGPCAARNHALLMLLWRTGARIGELLRLRPCDVTDTEVRILAQLKGGTERVLPLEPAVRAAVDRWLEHRPPGAGPLFVTLKGKPMHPSHVRRLLARLGAKAGLTRRTHAHAFRHAAATELAHAGAPLVAIQQLLGHRSLATTQAYVRRLTSAELADAVALRPLPAWAA